MQEPIILPFSNDVATSSTERVLLDRVFRTRPECYLSFGIGALVGEAASVGAREIVAIDSDIDRIRALSSYPAIKSLMDSDNIRVLLAEIGKTTEWGYPVGVESISVWHRYIADAWRACALRKKFPQVVHIRGRFRVACGLSVGLTLCDWGKPSPPTSPLVLLHDMSDSRSYYAPLRDFFEVVATADSLVVARWKSSMSRASALAMFLKFQFDPR